MKRGLVAVAVLVVAGAIAVVWWAPWNSPTDAVARARVAFGNRPVVHVVAQPSGRAGVSGVRPMVAMPETEIWVDSAHRRLHLVERMGGKIEVDAVEPLSQDRPRALLTFATRYREELDRGLLRRVGNGVVQSRSVIWLQSPDLRLAIDPVSYQPLWLAGRSATSLTQLVTAETKPFDPADFLTAKQKKPRHL